MTNYYVKEKDRLFTKSLECSRYKGASYIQQVVGDIEL